MITLAMIAALLMPPARFDHQPVEPFTIIEYADPRLFRSACPSDVGERILLACAAVDRRVIKIRADLTPAARKKVLRHEYGHLNGWSHP